jgi:hypothetical protein
LSFTGLVSFCDPWHDEGMPKRNSRKQKYRETDDPNVLAHRMVEVTTRLSEEPKDQRSLVSQVMAEMGRKGGQIGGKRRLETMSASERSKAALNAARARWSKRKKPTT